MAIGSAAYKQELTYWGTNGQDGYGAPLFDAPVKLPCRWEDRNEEFITDAGEKALSAAIVWTYQALEVDGYVALGDYTATANPLNVTATQVKRIQRSDEIPDLRGLNRENRHYL